MNLTALTQFIFKLNSLVDSGKYDGITIGEVQGHIDKGTILQFLQKYAGEDIDLSTHLNGAYGDFEAFYIKSLQSINDAYAGNARSKWRIEKSGLCLLIAWTNSIIEQGTGWCPNQNI